MKMSSVSNNLSTNTERLEKLMESHVDNADKLEKLMQSHIDLQKDNKSMREELAIQKLNKNYFCCKLCTQMGNIKKVP